MATSSTDSAIQETMITFQFFFSECQKVTTGILSSCRNSSLQAIFYQKHMMGS